jgi:hypothetical protein
VGIRVSNAEKGVGLEGRGACRERIRVRVRVRVSLGFL